MTQLDKTEMVTPKCIDYMKTHPNHGCVFVVVQVQDR